MNIKNPQKVATRCATLAPLLAGLLLTLALEGCSNFNATPIVAKDYQVATWEFRMASKLDAEQRLSLPNTEDAIEFGITATKGSADQSLASGQPPVILNKTSFNSPQQLKNEFDFTYADFSRRFRYFNLLGYVPLGLEVTAGAGYSSVGLKVSSTTQSASNHAESLGIRVGGGLIYRLHTNNSIQARASMFKATLQESGANQITRFELVYAKEFLHRFRLRAGIAGWNVYGIMMLGSDFNLQFYGPFAALDLETY